MRVYRRRLLSVAFSLLAAIASSPAAHAGELKLALANSTCAAMKQVGALYRESHSVELIYTCKSSGLLAKGLSGGALGADIYVSANRKWMDFVIKNDLVDADQVSSPWGNALVVAAPVTGGMQQLSWQELASDRVKTILIGDPSTAPFGRHAKEALAASGLWQHVRGKIETRKNIELLAEALGDSGPATVGILFKTNLTDRLQQLHTVDKSLHKPIRYFVAPLKVSQGKPEAADFLAFMHSPAAGAIFESEGYVVSDH